MKMEESEQEKEDEEAIEREKEGKEEMEVEQEEKKKQEELWKRKNIEVVKKLVKEVTWEPSQVGKEHVKKRDRCEES